MTKHSIDILVGRRIRAARLLREMSQEDLASKVGVTFQQIQKYEKAENRISASRLFDLAHALKLPMEHFFTSEKYTPILDRETISIASKYTNLSPSKRKLIKQLMKDL